jgi:uncharacterized repeat protein (TIGR01451 family)
MKKIISIAAAMVLCSVAVSAAGTDYNVDIKNKATLSYEVSGVAQNVEESNEDTFKVDRKVDVAVATTDSANIVVVPKINVPSDTKPLTFTVTNESNGAQDYILSASNLATDTATKDANEKDSVDFATDLKICVDVTCSAGDISGNNISFTEDETKTYYVFADILNTASDGDRGSIALTATAVDDGTTTAMTDDRATADDKLAVDVVFAEEAGEAVGDAQYDGKHSDLSAYEVVTAMIDVTKYSCVVSDGITVDAAFAKRIPGATVRYALDVNNTGTAATEGAILSDELQTDVTFVSGEIRNAACNCGTPAGTVISGDTVTYAKPNVTANFGEVTGGSHECAYFEVTIN